MLYNNSLTFSQKLQLTDHYLTSIMYLIMHLFCTARDISSHALGTIVSAMGPCGALGALGSSALTYLLLQFFALKIHVFEVCLHKIERVRAKL